MFGKSEQRKEFDRMYAEMQSADRKVEKLSQRLKELDAAIEKSRERLASLDSQISAAMSDSANWAKAEELANSIGTDRSKVSLALDLQLRARTSLLEEIQSAKVAAWNAEVGTRDAQGRAHAAAYDAALVEFSKIVREPLRQLVAKAYMATRHSGATMSIGMPHKAENLWNSVLVELIADMAGAPDFYDLVGTADSNCAPVDHVKSSVFSDGDRGRIQAEIKSGRSPLEALCASTEKPAVHQEPLSNGSYTYNAGFEMDKWSRTLNALEDHLEATIANPFSDPKKQEHAVSDLNSRIAYARQMVENWSKKRAA